MILEGWKLVKLVSLNFFVHEKSLKKAVLGLRSLGCYPEGEGEWLTTI
jgi:hypothetical protein